MPAGSGAGGLIKAQVICQTKKLAPMGSDRTGLVSELCSSEAPESPASVAVAAALGPAFAWAAALVDCAEAAQPPELEAAPLAPPPQQGSYSR